MNDYILLMHDDVPRNNRHRDDDWTGYFGKLRESGAFEGGFARTWMRHENS